jgi:formyl-CoA transferase
MQSHHVHDGQPSQADQPPLAGLLVADFSRVLAGPLASMFLADLGATVVKVERPGSGDDTRSWGPPYVGTATTYYTSVNRNKHSVAIDLTEPRDLRLARRLACGADVMLENYRPGKLAEFGLDATALAGDNPGLVYCSISGFGTGAGAGLPGYDFVAQAVGGLMSITGEPGGSPMKAGVALVDVLTGLHATIGILAALRERGQVVEVNLLSSLVSSLVNQGAAYINGGGVPSAMGNRHPSKRGSRPSGTSRPEPSGTAPGRRGHRHRDAGEPDHADTLARALPPRPAGARGGRQCRARVANPGRR